MIVGINEDINIGLILIQTKWTTWRATITKSEILMKGKSGIRKMGAQRKRILTIPPAPSFNNAPNSESINGPNNNHATQNKSSEQPKTPINRRPRSHLFWHHKLPRSAPQNSNKPNQATLSKNAKTKFKLPNTQHNNKDQRCFP
ncbi:hypothetical protein V8G54_033944 [Vigna mungo]|uniref:Uncharacterized protein n=1 Tax=Vigna mungo TaxID=3915 RepID=A0AAQ3RI24_VIGMU